MLRNRPLWRPTLARQCALSGGSCHPYHHRLSRVGGQRPRASLLLAATHASPFCFKAIAIAGARCIDLSSIQERKPFRARRGKKPGKPCAHLSPLARDSGLTSTLIQHGLFGWMLSAPVRWGCMCRTFRRESSRSCQPHPRPATVCANHYLKHPCSFPEYDTRVQASVERLLVRGRVSAVGREAWLTELPCRPVSPPPCTAAMAGGSGSPRCGSKPPVQPPWQGGSGSPRCGSWFHRTRANKAGGAQRAGVRAWHRCAAWNSY